MPASREIEAFGVSDTGRVREHNEDALRLEPARGLFVVADGMGGHLGGQTAARLAVDTLAAVPGPAAGEVEARMATLAARVRAACRLIFETSRDDLSLRGMGTTVTCLWLEGGQAVVAHVGDSRCYLLRDGRLRQLTDDHSLVNEQLRAGILSPEEARNSRQKNVITRSVGFEADVMVDTLALPLEAGDRFLLCSDGLSNLVADPELERLLVAELPARAPASLVALANERGGDDNVTAVVVALAPWGAPP